MVHLVDKSALVAEIERRKQDAINNCGGFKSIREHKCDSCIVGQYEEMEEILNTLEVKEVDLDFMLHEYWGVFPKICVDCLESATMTKDEMIDFAKHFFELGVRVNNPITAADRGTAEEIIINLKRVEQDYHIDLTREIEWLSNKVQRGE